ncbi:hypothetical protein GH5_08333 [Leishmania sp. Ghana 2012 LV757]|uniref:hypothetical protein n=1 Tax=Leishmania sp. Ghana 2012 LV757 TaxID=2803181 RepID=UPI001B74A468|nr:hypothetical protein GH5_08333 [Leishmania sp. Ghana 2012 LV757]
MQSSPTPSAAAAGTALDPQHEGGSALAPPFAMDIEGTLTGTPAAAAAAPMASLHIASSVTVSTRACVPDSHGSVSKVQHRIFASPSCTAASLLQTTSCTLPSRQPRRLALTSTTMPAVSHASQRSGSGNSEDALATHTAMPPILSPSLGAEVRSLCPTHFCTYIVLQPSCDVANEGRAPQHRCGCTRSWLSKGALTALAESRASNPLPSAPSHNGAAAVCDAGEVFECASALSVPATVPNLYSTESAARRARVSPSSLPPAVKPTDVPHVPLLGRENQANASPRCRCSMSIPSPPLVVSPFARRPSTPGRTVGACGPARGTEPEAVHHHRFESAPPRMVAHELLSTRCTAELAMPVGLPTAHRRSLCVFGANVQGSFSLNEDGAESSAAAAATTAHTPLMFSDTSRATVFSGAASATTTTTTNATPHRSTLLAVTHRGSRAFTPMQCTASFSSKIGSSVCASAAVAEAALLLTPSALPPHPPSAPSRATTSERQSDRDEESAEVPAAAAALAAASAMRPVNRLLRGPVTSVRREDLAWFLSPFCHVNAQSNLAAAPLYLCACLATECDRVMRAVLRQEVWAQETTTGREELWRQVAGHIFARCHNRGERLLEDAPAQRRRAAAPWPDQGLLPRDAVLVADVGNSSVGSGAAATVAIAGDTPSSQASFLRLLRAPWLFLRCRRGAVTPPEEPVTGAACSEAAGDERTEVAMESPAGMEAAVGSATVEASVWTQSQWRLRRIDAWASVPLPLGVSGPRLSSISASSSLSYEAALLAAAREMSG